MILYKFKDAERGHDTIFMCEESEDFTKKCYTPRNQAAFFVQYILKENISSITGWKNSDFKGKRFLDIGMGNGNILYYVKDLLEADVYGVDINNYLDYDNYIKGKTFANMDVCDLPEELLGTFDVAYQCLFSVPFKDTAKVLLAASKTLKPDGHYLVTFDDEYYEHDDSFVIKILKEIYSNVVIKKRDEKIKVCIASHPRLNPVLSPMENYYCVVTDEEYWNFKSMTYDNRIKFLDMSADQRKDFLNTFVKK